MYYLLPKAQRWLLLCGNILFYAYADPRMLIYLIICIGLTYLAGLLIFRASDKASRRAWLIIALIADFAALAVFKYANFILSAFSSRRLSLVVPLGISYITFQTVTYLVDIYNGKISSPARFFDYALYVSFFPNVTQGPIEKAKELLPQFHKTHGFDAKAVRVGAWSMLIGLLMKMALADLVATPVNTVFSALSTSSGADIIFATALFAVQLYADFAGYSLIAIGAAKVLGIELHRNFRQPYHSVTVAEFWRRWHISLSIWLKEYIYIPLGGNRRGTARKYLNLLIVFLFSGIWHGAAIGYLIWGVLNGLYIVLGQMLSAGKRGNEKTASRHSIFLRQLRTALLVSVTWVFFRAGTWQNICIAFDRIFLHLEPLAFILRAARTALHMNSQQLLGLGGLKYIQIILGIVVLAIMDHKEDQKPGIVLRIAEKPLRLRMMILAVVIFSILIFGVYGYGYQSSSFVYTQF